ncbi:glycoside hydrolase family 3 N-terminal domain-containing protein [Saccharopolyspora sp. NPDC002376]
MDEAQLWSLLEELTTAEKARLLTGASFWTSHPMPKVGLRSMVLSDGPNGVRGTEWDESDTSLLLPVASAMGATWDRTAARAAGELFGDEARRRGAHVVLAPTVNVHRSPFGGRHFENVRVAAWGEVVAVAGECERGTRRARVRGERHRALPGRGLGP